MGTKNDQSTRQPVEGDVVDADRDFSELCSRMRETGKTSCTILFCNQDVYIEADEGRSGEHYFCEAPQSSRTSGRKLTSSFLE